MSHALIIVDMLADFVRPGAALFVPGSPEIVPAIQQELAAAPPGRGLGHLRV